VIGYGSDRLDALVHLPSWLLDQLGRFHMSTGSLFLLSSRPPRHMYMSLNPKSSADDLPDFDLRTS